MYVDLRSIYVKFLNVINFISSENERNLCELYYFKMIEIIFFIYKLVVRTNPGYC